MQYALLIYAREDAMDHLTEAEQIAIRDEYFAIRDEPGCLGGARLAPVETATTLRAGDGETLITDGPFADTKEVFGGYYLFERDNLDEVLEIAARIPVLKLGGSLEIRAIVA